MKPVIKRVFDLLLQRIGAGLPNGAPTTEMSNRLVVILGCTGTGKSDLGIAIAKNFNGEVINADSMQIYKGTVFSYKSYSLV